MMEMLDIGDTPLELPYYASSIPWPLPTKAKIESSPSVKEYEYSGDVVRVGDHFVVKYGPQVNLLEGENMLFIRKTTHVPIPQVYALYSDADTKINYIVMEFVKGVTLAAIWSSLSTEQIHLITIKLKFCFEELRSLPSPGYFGSIGRRYLLDGIFWVPERLPVITGPFDNEAAMNEGMAQKCARDGQSGSIHKANFYRRSLARVFQGHAPTFTHADFQRKNILVDIVSETEIIVTLIDWEKAGWYPSYWEYSMAMIATRWDNSWVEWIEKVLEPFSAEYPWLQMLFLELWS